MSWLHTLLNMIYGQKMSVVKYKSLFTDNTQAVFKANALDLVDEWILNKVQIALVHAAASVGARDMEDLLKMENSKLVSQYATGDWEQLDSTDNLKEYINHYHTKLNQHINLKMPYRDRKFIMISKYISALFPINKNINGKNWLEIKNTTPAPSGLDYDLGSIY